MQKGNYFGFTLRSSLFGNVRQKQKCVITTLKCQHIHNEKKYILYEIIIIKINTNLGCKRFLIGE